MMEFDQIEDLVPKQAESSILALQISKSVLRLPDFQSICHVMSEHKNLGTFCGYLAREVIDPVIKKRWEEQHGTSS